MSSGFSGERPGWGDEHFQYDEARHIAAYLYAAQLASGKRVLDAGCGEGFGTQTLAPVAASVVGIDYSEDAIAYSRSKWRAPNIRFERVDLTNPRGFDEKFDLVLNFQVLEHIDDEVPFLEALRALLAPNGVLLLTTPNRLRSFSENPYHVREYTQAELGGLLTKVFDAVVLSGMHGNEKVTAFDQRREREVQRVLRLDPLRIRRFLPRRAVEAAFAKLGIYVRKRASANEPGQSIAPSDFYVSPTRLDEALDLIALCESRG